MILPSSSRALVTSHNSSLEFTSLAKLLSGNLLAEVDLYRAVVSLKLRQDKKASMGQFLTPASVAQLMTGMFNSLDLPEISLLDAGAGIGSLIAAFVAKVCKQRKPTSSLRVVAYEIDPFLIKYLHQTLELCKKECDYASISLNYEIRETDFIEDAVRLQKLGLLNSAMPTAVNYATEFTHAILNPPYLKINAHSKMRELLRSIGLETSNLYTGFMAATAQLLKPNGEFVAITPRSFCNGPYFRDFRKMFLEMMALEQVHLFESRQEAFSDDDVLQETIIIQATKQKQKSSSVSINSSCSANDDLIVSHSVPYTALVNPDDLEQFIHIIPDNLSQQIVQRMAVFTCTLKDLGLTVSTGRIVDFRVKDYLRINQENNTVPLIYPVNLANGYVEHPKITKKSQAIVYIEETANLLIPNEHYVLCKRFSSKEEKRRVVAVVYDANQFNYSCVGFENHLNYFHKDGRGLSLTLARGLAIYLNSTLVDAFFRLFNGHTQVNATDLRKLKYPNLEQLLSLGTEFKDQFPSLQEIDELIENKLLSMSNLSENNPVATKSRIDEALQILTQLSLPRAQLNERSALTLLALLDLKPTDSWQLATSPLIGITPMMNFMAQHYGKTYKPNTRETVRRQTVHQFLDAALIIANPDDLSRPINSPKTVYQIEGSALELLRTYGTDEWDKSICTYLASVESLKKQYAQERAISRIPIVINGKIKTLSPGGQNILIEKIINDFAPRFTPGGKLIYVGDTDEKFAYFDETVLADLGINIDSHGKIPDVIIHFTKNNWLVLIEAVTSHGPINPKRKKELEVLFRDVQIPLVMVTTFLSRKAMVGYLAEIAWETDVWVADDSTHLIHFNGEYLLQAYQTDKKQTS
ncbi:MULTISPECIES: BsuBI/PstI family type II restriction endonuclease [unclassified Nostoc]|uniref:BsuBI/PstI family type II restriction endonuclease n=1 Tax=unclassified Nostoc TaxID=2593658 RepID=UPI002AD2F424|nr:MULTISPECIES: BsuBI/PstI family type II restriction endonuclease [unclassified Nostoc]MDZ8124184.1 BsuBI/PstI family type II restriction endonuclease [Nostoc sp. CmiVER01]MDZ8224810.1 BsuBI/PstI family type II restriction endonuclease [Nostoc sp. ChiVER01]